MVVGIEVRRAEGLDVARDFVDIYTTPGNGVVPTMMTSERFLDCGGPASSASAAGADAAEAGAGGAKAATASSVAANTCWRAPAPRIVLIQAFEQCGWRASREKLPT